MGTRALSLTGGRKSYPGRPDVLQGVEIGVDQGEFLVILGRSGSGKSTLLRIMAGLETLTGATSSGRSRTRASASCSSNRCCCRG